MPTDWRRAPAVSEGTGSLWATAASATVVLEAVTFVEALATAVCMDMAATGGPITIMAIARLITTVTVSQPDAKKAGLCPNLRMKIQRRRGG